MVRRVPALSVAFLLSLSGAVGYAQAPAEPTSSAAQVLDQVPAPGTEPSAVKSPTEPVQQPKIGEIPGSSASLGPDVVGAGGQTGIPSRSQPPAQPTLPVQPGQAAETIHQFQLQQLRQQRRQGQPGPQMQFGGFNPAEQQSPRGGRRAPVSLDLLLKALPLYRALDANGDGEISQEEIGNASIALRPLDKNGDGKLSGDELGPRLPRNETVFQPSWEGVSRIFGGGNPTQNGPGPGIGDPNGPAPFGQRQFEPPQGAPGFGPPGPGPGGSGFGPQGGSGPHPGNGPGANPFGGQGPGPNGNGPNVRGQGGPEQRGPEQFVPGPNGIGQGGRGDFGGNRNGGGSNNGGPGVGRPWNPGPDRPGFEGPGGPGQENRGPDHRGPDHRGPDNRGPNNRIDGSFGPGGQGPRFEGGGGPNHFDGPGAFDRGPGQPNTGWGGPDQRRPNDGGQEHRGPNHRGPDNFAPGGQGPNSGGNWSPNPFDGPGRFDHGPGQPDSGWGGPDRRRPSDRGPNDRGPESRRPDPRERMPDWRGFEFRRQDGAGRGDRGPEFERPEDRRPERRGFVPNDRRFRPNLRGQNRPGQANRGPDDRRRGRPDQIVDRMMQFDDDHDGGLSRDELRQLIYEIQEGGNRFTESRPLRIRVVQPEDLRSVERQSEDEVPNESPIRRIEIHAEEVSRPNGEPPVTRRTRIEQRPSDEIRQESERRTEREQRNVTPRDPNARRPAGNRSRRSDDRARDSRRPSVDRPEEPSEPANQRAAEPRSERRIPRQDPQIEQPSVEVRSIQEVRRSDELPQGESARETKVVEPIPASSPIDDELGPEAQ